MSPGAPAGPERDVLLDALDRVRDVRGSLPLFDALVADDSARVRQTLATCPRHPLYATLVAWLEARGLPGPDIEGPGAALARHGIEDLEAFVAATAAREALLQRTLADTRAERDLALRSANAYALVAALLAVVAIVGWFSALGGLPLPEEPPSNPEPTPTRSPSENPR